MREEDVADCVGSACDRNVIIEQSFLYKGIGKAPSAIGPYSQAIETSGTVYVSGQLPIVPETGTFAQGGIKEETRQCFRNIQNILAQALPKGANIEIEAIATK